MTKSWRATAAVIVAVVAWIPACKTRPKPATVTVRIFRDLNSPYAQQLDHRILEFQGTNPRLANGAAVQVGSLNIADYKSAVSNMDDPSVEIVILNTPQDAVNFPALQPELPHAVNVCAAVQACPADVPALVPSRLSGDRAEAANKFVQFLAAQK
jgi:hypothetical protein